MTLKKNIQSPIWNKKPSEKGLYTKRKKMRGLH